MQWGEKRVKDEGVARKEGENETLEREGQDLPGGMKTP